MKFTKLAKSDKFEYMMLSRLIQDAKYFINYPDLKHLWARTLDEHIKQMKEQYTKLDPKPEWTSEEEINDLAKQMNESYTNHWNEVRPDNKIEAAAKEYTILYRSEKEREADSDFHTYKTLKDKKRAIELAKDLFKKMNYEGEVNVDSGDYNYYSTDNYDWDKINKMNSKDYKNGYRDGKDDYEIGHPADPDDLKDTFSEEYIEGYWQGFNDAQEKEFYKQSAIQQPNKPKPTTTLPDNMQWAWDPEAADWVAVLKDNTNTTPPLYDPNNQNVVNQTTSYMSTVKSACLSKFLDGPRYSKEIKIEAGLIKEGLVKYAGFDFNRGTKYAITTKGLEVLRKASETEHNEALNEREKLAYMFGFNTDEISTLDTTGKVIKQSARKWTICEADGTELGEVVADSELDAKVKFGIEHPEYADSQSICAKEIDAKYEETTEQHLDYPNPSETPTTDVILENHDGWVNTADQKRPYTEEEKRLLPLFRLLNQHVAKKEIQLVEDPQKDGNIVATGQAEVINDLEHEVKDLGFHCEPIAEITDEDYIGYDIYSLRIFTK